MLKILVIFILVFSNQSKAADTIRTDTIRDAGDIFQIAMPLAGLGAAYFSEQEDFKVFTTGLVVNAVLTQGLKYSINRTRPDGGDLSFPSGHTSVAFHSAAFINKQYGKKFGIPAYVGATIVGYSRVRAKRHYTTDVIAGALIGIGSNWLAEKYVETSIHRDSENTLWFKFSKEF